MTNEQILKKAIEKALDNNWMPSRPYLRTLINEGIYPTAKEVLSQLHISEFIFSHNFAEAFYGEEKVDSFGNKVIKISAKKNRPEYGCYEAGGTVYTEDEVYEFLLAFEYHLQQQVLEKDPIKYLEKFL